MQVIPPVFLQPSSPRGDREARNLLKAATQDFSFNRRKSTDTVLSSSGSGAHDEGDDARLSNVWLDENNRCLVPDNMIAFFKEYSKTPGAHWSNEVVRVERAVRVEWLELAALSYVKAAVCRCPR